MKLENLLITKERDGEWSCSYKGVSKHFTNIKDMYTYLYKNYEHDIRWAASNIWIGDDPNPEVTSADSLIYILEQIGNVNYDPFNSLETPRKKEYSYFDIKRELESGFYGTMLKDYALVSWMMSMPISIKYVNKIEDGYLALSIDYKKHGNVDIINNEEFDTTKSIDDLERTFMHLRYRINNYGDFFTLIMNYKNIYVKAAKFKDPMSLLVSLYNTTSTFFAIKAVDAHFRNHIKLFGWFLFRSEKEKKLFSIAEGAGYILKRLNKDIINFPIDEIRYIYSNIKDFSAQEVEYVYSDMKKLHYYHRMYIWSFPIIDYAEYEKYKQATPYPAKKGLFPVVAAAPHKSLWHKLNNLRNRFEYYKLLADTKIEYDGLLNYLNISTKQYGELVERLLHRPKYWSIKSLLSINIEVLDMVHSVKEILKHPEQYDEEIVKMAKGLKVVEYISMNNYFTIKKEKAKQMSARTFLKEYGKLYHIHAYYINKRNEELVSDPREVPALIHKMPPALEVYRLRTYGEYARAGIENHNCVATYANREDSIIYRFDTVTVELEPNTFKIMQCYDKNNTITANSKKVERKIRQIVKEYKDKNKE